MYYMQYLGVVIVAVSTLAFFLHLNPNDIMAQKIRDEMLKKHGMLF